MTPDQLCDIEGVKAAKYAYLRCLDTKNWDEIRTLFTEDATAAYSGGAYSATGREEIVGFLERNMGSPSFHSSHRVSHPEVVLDGDRASATWALHDTVVDAEMGILIMGAAFYEDTYVRDGDRWLIATTGYRRSFEFLVPTSDMPGFALTASWWGTDGRSTLPAG